LKSKDVVTLEENGRSLSWAVPDTWKRIMVWMRENCPDGDVTIRFANACPVKVIGTPIPNIRFDKPLRDTQSTPA